MVEHLVKSVFILRPDNLGDVVLFSGAFYHIRNHYPNAKITLCVQRYVVNYIELCPFIDEIICWEDLATSTTINLAKNLNSKSAIKNLLVRTHLKYSTVSTSKNFNWLFKYSSLAVKLKKYNVDILIMPVRSANSWIHTVANFISAKIKYGILGDLHNISEEDDRLSRHIYTKYLDLSQEQKLKHEINTNQEFLALLGIKVDESDLWPGIWTNNNDVAWALEYVPKNKDSWILAICPGANSFKGKIYPTEKYSEIISAITEKKLSVVILGSSSEIVLCQELKNALEKCQNVVSIGYFAGTTIRQAIELLRKSDLVLTVDNGAMHLSITLAKATVSIVGGGSFVRFFPWGNPLLNRFVYKLMDCYGCKWHCQYSTVRCITEVSSKMVIDEINSLLKEL